jgi:hypothetical protein
MNPQAVGIPAWTVYAALVALGALIMLAAILVLPRIIDKPFLNNVAQLLAPVASFAIGTQATRLHGIRSVDLTGFEAAILSFLGAAGAVLVMIVAWVVMVFAIAVWIWWRFGFSPSAGFVRDLLVGSNRADLWKHFKGRNTADELWDEFSFAVSEARRDLRLAGEVSLPVADRAIESDTPLPLDGEPLRQLLQRTIGETLKTFSAETHHSAWRFSCWRIATQGNHLERVWITSNHPSRGPLAIWIDGNSALGPATVAAASMVDGRHVCVDASSTLRNRFPIGQLGVTYQAFRIDPLRLPGSGEVWGILCTDLLNGSVPIRCRSVGALVRDVASAVESLAPHIAQRTIEQCRADEASPTGA